MRPDETNNNFNIDEGEASMDVYGVANNPENRRRLQAETKVAISNLLQMAEQIDRVTPLIQDNEHVVEHLQRIEEHFENLYDNLSEVRDYMVTLLEHMMENDDANVQ